MSRFQQGDEVWIKGVVNGIVPDNGDRQPELTFVKINPQPDIAMTVAAISNDGDILPAGDVPTPEERAAVEKITQAFTMSKMYMRYVKTTDPEVFDANVAIALRERFEEIRDSITESDIEAAQRVAGGK